MMDQRVRQCKQCGRLFQSAVSGYCRDCIEEMDRAFVTVKEYIYSHGGADIREIAHKTGVEEKLVLRLLREGRLSIDQGGEGGETLLCQKCGQPIKIGRYCDGCRVELEAALGSVIAAVKKTETPEPEPRKPVWTRYGRDYRFLR